VEFSPITDFMGQTPEVGNIKRWAIRSLSGRAGWFVIGYHNIIAVFN
jgi:hypothetical protein